MAIEFKQVNFTYSPNSPFEYHAIKDISISFREHKMTAIIGPTGSGKSTLVQHLNALLIPDTGEVIVKDKRIIAKTKNKGLKELRQKVGLVFQFPEAQLFEETVLKDVQFGPTNFGQSPETALESAKHALALVGLDESYYQRSPLELSGGQKRRVAIAGILAVKPDVLVCDEPTAGLDPQGAFAMMTLFKQFQLELNKTVLLVTHNLQHVLDYCDDVLVMNKGKVSFHGTVTEFFDNQELLSELQLVLPKVILFKQQLNKKGFHIPEHVTSIQHLAQAIVKEIGHE